MIKKTLAKVITIVKPLAIGLSFATPLNAVPFVTVPFVTGTLRDRAIRDRHFMRKIHRTLDH